MARHDADPFAPTWRRTSIDGNGETATGVTV